MKKLFLIMFVAALFACNNESETDTLSDTTVIEQDNTINRDTSMINTDTSMNRDTTIR